MIGQNWHPMFPVDGFPATISFNTGAPFVPFSRNPQIRYTVTVGWLSVLATAYSQRDFVHSGPAGASSKYLRNSGIPGVDIQLQIRPDSSEHIFSVGTDYKTIVPSLVTYTGYKTTESLGSYAVYSAMKFKYKPVSIKFMAVLAQNASDMLMIGGYAIRDTVNPDRGALHYTNVNTGSGWIDIHTNSKKVQPGIYAGYTKNLGTSNSAKGNYYGRGTNIAYVYRIAPRISIFSGKSIFATEIEYTTAAYGKNKLSGVVMDTKEVSNIRLLLSYIYNF